MLRRFLSLAVIACFSSYAWAQSATSNWDWSDQVVTGDDLKITLGNVMDKVIVTLWMDNVYNQWEQNKKNERVKGTVKALIERYHPNTVYVEADVSDYNRNAYTFEEQATFWGIDLKVLSEGPMIMPVYQKHGQIFWGSNQTHTISLVRALHKHLVDVERAEFGTEPSDDVDIELIFNEVNEYNNYNPWQPYDHFYPGKPDAKHVERLEREGKTPPPPPKKEKPRMSLKEPEKSFN